MEKIKRKEVRRDDNNTGKSERGSWENHYGSESCWVSGGEEEKGIAN